MKYKVGDKVKVKSEFDFYEEYRDKQFVIEECHKRNLECHAWIVPYRIGTSSDANKYVSNKVKHPFITNPELCVEYNGSYFHKSNKYHNNLSFYSKIPLMKESHLFSLPLLFLWNMY